MVSAPPVTIVTLSLYPVCERRKVVIVIIWLSQKPRFLVVWRSVYPLCLLHDLDMCHRHPRRSDHQVLQRHHLPWSTAILTWSTRSTPHLLLLVDVPKCQPPRLAFWPSWSLGPSLTSILRRSQSIGMACLYLTFSMSVNRLRAPHLHTNTTKRHVAHILTQWLVSKLNQRRSSPTITHHTLDTQEHISTCVRSKLDHEMLVRC